MKYQLRPYQVDCCRSVLERFAQHPSTLVEMATGLGKAVLLVHLAHHWNQGRVLILIHRQELADQTAEKWQAIAGEKAAIEMGDDRIEQSVFGTPRTVIGSVQTMSRIVAGLLRAKLVRRKTDLQDRRAVVIQATEKGIHIMQEGRRRRVDALAAVIRGLPQKEVAKLQEAAQLMESLSRQA